MRIFKSKFKSKSDRCGAAAVEFAVVAPVLVLLTFSMMEGSRFLQATDAAQGAAREASRAAAIFGPNCPSCQEIAEKFMNNSGFPSDNIEVIQRTEPVSVPGYHLIEYTVRIDYSDVSLLGNPFSFNVTRIEGHSAILAEISP